MADTRSDDNLVDELAEDFARRWRAGERPSIEEHARRYPDCADEIRAVLQAVVMMEQLKPRREDAGTLTAPPHPHDRPPERMGDYRIVREIGRGGMGVVYEAEQEALGRRVAIKVLPGHLLANETVRSRFRREAQAAARLHHTNIVPVFGVGEDAGRCFYVMQLIHGRGLDQVMRERALSPHEVAHIGAQVADALACAHAQGVLHRDVKPQNLLLDDRGAVWVTDFGVAKLVEEANLTQSGDLVGTLKYMPPERFAGVSDGRGDVYSLGVTLYELLAKRPAFPDTTPQHIIQLITQEGPRPLRKLEPAVPTDLETIVLKAAARDPAHRYPTPAELADDLRRFLDDRPILARRTGPAQRAWRWCRRNPALASATAFAFLLMCAITVVSVVAYVRTAAANREAALALESETAQRRQAEQTSTLALDALNRIFDRFAPTRLVVTPPATDDESGVELPFQPSLPPEAIVLLEDLLRTYQQVARAGGEHLSLRSKAAEANYHIGEICGRLGRFDEADAAFRAAIELYQHLLDELGDDAVRIKLARACNESGRALRALQQPDEALRMHERAIGVLTEAPSPFAGRPECRYELARSYCALGQRDMMLSPGGPGPGGPPDGRRPGHHEGPRMRNEPGARKGRRQGPPGGPPGGPPEPRENAAAGKAVALLERLVDGFPRVPEYRHLLACCYRDTPPERFGRGGPQGAKPDRAVDLLRQLVKDFPRVPDYRLDLCEALARPGPPGRGGDRARRQEGMEEAIALSEQLVAQYPNVPAYAAARARYLDFLGLTLFDAGKLDEAERRHRDAVTLQARLVKQYPDVVAYRFWLGLMERSLGKVLGERGQVKEARALIESGIGRVEALWKKDARLGGARPFLGMAYRDLARVLARGGESELAAKAQRKADDHGPGRGPPPFGPRSRGEGRR
jgi:tetratricopeptide (TPR) repeat protein/predicted Ser/Thr protein kinase